jgi:hypothetical protein
MLRASQRLETEKASSCSKTLTVTAMLFDHISLGRDQFTYIAKQQAYNAS